MSTNLDQAAVKNANIPFSDKNTDRTVLLIVLFVISTTLLLLTHDRNIMGSWGNFGVLLSNKISESIIVSLFLSNVLFAYLWKAQNWAKILVSAASLLFILPFASRQDPSLLDLGIQIMIFAALSLGLNIVVGLAGLLDLGYIAFFAVGAYVWGIVASPRVAEILHYFGENPAASGPATFAIGLILTVAGFMLLKVFQKRAEQLGGILGAAGFSVIALSVFCGLTVFFTKSMPSMASIVLLSLFVFSPLIIMFYHESIGKKVKSSLVIFRNTIASIVLVFGVIFIARGVLIMSSGFSDGLVATQGVDANFFWLFIPISIAAAALVGVLIGLPVLKLKGDYLAIITLALGEVIRILANNLDLYTAGSQGVTPIKTAYVPWFDSIGRSLGFTNDQLPLLFLYFLIIGLIVLIIIANIRLDKSRIGRAWIAIRDDEVAAQAMGVPLMKTKLIAFAAGASFAGVMGMIFAAKQTFVSPESFILHQSIAVLSMVILGGMGSIPGVMLGAAVITLLNLRLLPGIGEVTASVPWIPSAFDPSQYQRFIFGSILVAMMLWRPDGLLPNRRHILEQTSKEDNNDGGPTPPVDVVHASGERR